MSELSLITPVIDGKFTPYVASGLRDFVKQCEGKKLEIILKEYKKKRSLNQNRFYFGQIIPRVRAWMLEQGINFDANETHEFIVRHVWKWTEVIHLPDGTPYERRLSSTKLTTSEWEQRIEITRQYFSEKNLILPEPENKNTETSALPEVPEA